MTTRQGMNPIEKRLELLSTLWDEFACQTGPRLLRWLISQPDARMLEVFFEVQEQEAGSDIPDLFVRLRTSFEDPLRYGFQLAEEVALLYDQSREELHADHIDASWTRPEPADGASDVAEFVRACASLQSHHNCLMLQLALILQPESISSPQDWQAWLGRLLGVECPETVRFTVVDVAESPVLVNLAKSFPTLVKTAVPELAMGAAAAEISRQAGVSGAGNQFRNLYVDLTNLAQRGPSQTLGDKAHQALRIAIEQKWHHLEVAVHLLLAAVFLSAGQTEKAAAAYRAGGVAAGQAHEAGDPSGGKLIVQARFGEAVTLVREGKFAEAGRVYEQTAPIAAGAEDKFLEMEAWRMAGYCHEQCKMPDLASRCLWTALETAEKLDEATRRNSTIPYVGQGLLRLAASSDSDASYHAIHAKMIELVGSDWEGSLR